MAVAGFKVGAQRYALDCVSSLLEDQLDEIADLIPEDMLEAMRPARAGGRRRRATRAKAKG
jgi:hypothetical protein